MTPTENLQSVLKRIESKHGIHVYHAEPVHGGDIHQSYRLLTADGPLFLKFQPAQVKGLFDAEADGLKALALAVDADGSGSSGGSEGSEGSEGSTGSGGSEGSEGSGSSEDSVDTDGSGGSRGSGGSVDTDGSGGSRGSEGSRGSGGSTGSQGPPSTKGAGVRKLRVPAVIAMDPDKYLLMEFIESGKRTDEAFQQLGRGLARMHLLEQPSFGWHRDNFIGLLPQRNRQHTTWVDFFAEERIEPQLRRAVDTRQLPAALLKHWNRLRQKLPSIFPTMAPALQHGDLWSGNILFDTEGRGVLIDPAVAAGHPEMDLAFTRMFGGFSAGFYRAYEEVLPLEPGFEDRVPFYNLYPLLVHVNLFGGGYTTSARTFLKTH